MGLWIQAVRRRRGKMGRPQVGLVGGIIHIALLGVALVFRVHNWLRWDRGNHVYYKLSCLHYSPVHACIAVRARYRELCCDLCLFCTVIRDARCTMLISRRYRLARDD